MTVLDIAYVIMLVLTGVACLSDLVHTDRLYNVEDDNTRLRAELADARDKCGQVQQQLDQQNERVGAYLRESFLLSLEIDYLRQGDDMDAGAIIEDLEAYLEAQP